MKIACFFFKMTRYQGQKVKKPFDSNINDNSAA